MPKFNWNDVPDQSFEPLPNGHWEFECLEIDKRISQASGRLMYTARYVGTESNPDEGIGRTIFENYVVGPPDDPDPQSIDVENNIGLMRMVAHAKSMNIPPTDDLDELATEMQGKRLIARTSLRQDNKGVDRPNIVVTFPVGTKSPLGPSNDARRGQTRSAMQGNAQQSQTVRERYTPPSVDV